MSLNRPIVKPGVRSAKQITRVCTTEETAVAPGRMVGYIDVLESGGRDRR